LSATYQQALIPIGNPETYGAVYAAVAAAFSKSGVERFLNSLKRGRARIRAFEDVLGKGLLGPETAARYALLDNGDQGQIREFYLASLEQVAPDLRQKFFRLYAYY